MTIGGVTFNWFIILIALIGLIYAVRAAIGYYNVAKDAHEDYDYKKRNDMMDARLSEAEYVNIYRRTNNPRSTAYIAMTIFTIFVITPVSMFIFEHVYTFIYNVSGQSRVIEPGFLVWQFFIFFFFIANCAVIAYFMARRYHRNTPGTLSVEIDQAVRKM